MPKSSDGAAVKILLDTNFLLTMVRHKIHGFEDLKEKGKFEFFVLESVIGEMEALGRQDKKISNEVRVVKEILKKNDVKVLETSVPIVDDDLVQRSKDYVVATNDKALRDKIRAMGGKTAYIRSLTYVEMD
jgi:rRNA-processing protein FCF1